MRRRGRGQPRGVRYPDGVVEKGPEKVLTNERLGISDERSIAAATREVVSDGVISLASIAMSVPAPTAMRLSAAASAGASFYAVTTMATVRPLLQTAHLPRFVRRRTSERTRSIPAWRAMASAVSPPVARYP